MVTSWYWLQRGWACSLVLPLLRNNGKSSWVIVSKTMQFGTSHSVHVLNIQECWELCSGSWFPLPHLTAWSPWHASCHPSGLSSQILPMLLPFLVSHDRNWWNQKYTNKVPEQSLHMFPRPTGCILHIISSIIVLKTDLNLSLLCLLLRCRLSVRSKLLGVAARLQPSPLSHVPFILATLEGAVFSRLTLLSRYAVPWLSTLFRLPVPLSGLDSWPSH